MSVKNYEILSPEDMEKKNKTGYFACHYVNSSFQRWRFAVLLTLEFQKIGEIPGIRWSYNMSTVRNDKYVVLLQNVENLNSPALQKAKEIARCPWWHFHGTAALLQIIIKDIQELLK